MQLGLRDALVPAATEHESSDDELDLVLDAVADVPARPVLMDLGLEGDVLAEHVHALVELRLRYRAALRARRDPE